MHRQIHGGRDRGVARYAHAEQLMGSQPEEVEHDAVHPGQGPVHAVRDDRIVAAPESQGSVRQGRGETRVPP